MRQRGYGSFFSGTDASQNSRHQFEIGIFTNLGEDHIGPNEHKDFEDYKRCKGILFTQCNLGPVDRWYEDAFKNATCKVETFGFSEKADLRYRRSIFQGLDIWESSIR